MQGKTKVHIFFANENRKSRQTKQKSEFELTWSDREKGDAVIEDRRLGGRLSTTLEEDRRPLLGDR